MRATPETNKLFFDEYGREVQVRRELAIEKFRQLECQRDEVRELARELRNALEAILDWEPRQKDEVERIAYKLGRESLTKTKEVLGEY